MMTGWGLRATDGAWLRGFHKKEPDTTLRHLAALLFLRREDAAKLREELLSWERWWSVQSIEVPE